MYAFEPELCKRSKQILEMHNLSDKLCTTHAYDYIRTSIQIKQEDIIHNILTRIVSRTQYIIDAHSTSIFPFLISAVFNVMMVME